MSLINIVYGIERYKIWLIILVLISASIALLFILVLIRYFTDFIKARKKIRKDLLKKLIVTYLESPIEGGGGALFKLNNRDRNIISEIAMDILHIVVGDEKAKLLELLHDLKIDQLMIENLNHRRVGRRILAIELLSYWHSEDIGEIICTKLSDKNFAVRLAASYVLASMNGEKYFSFIYQKIVQDNQFSYPLLSEIFYKCGIEIVDQLADILTYGKVENKIQAAAIKILGDFRSAKNWQTIANFCYNQNDSLRALAYESLSKLNIKISDRIIFRGLTDTFWQVRFNALKLLANIDFSYFEKLKNLLNDKNWVIRNRTLQIIFESGPEGKKFLATLANQNLESGKIAYQFLNEKGVLENV